MKRYEMEVTQGMQWRFATEIAQARRGTSSLAPPLRSSDLLGLLPHEMFAALYREAPEVFRELLCGPPGFLHDWWQHAFQRGGDWLQNEFLHSATADTATADQRIPIGIHGDDGEYVTSEKVLVLSWGPVGPSGHATLDSRWLFSMLRLSEAAYPESWHQLLAVLAWSLRSLAEGKHPSVDHTGAPLTGDRGRLAGTPLTGDGYRGIFAEMRGDWKFLRESLHFTHHYSHNIYICHRCKASREIKRLLYTDFRRTARHRRTVIPASIWRRDAERQPRVSPLLQIPGFSIERVFFDALHTLDLGVYQVVVPTAMAELAASGAHVFAGFTSQA